VAALENLGFEDIVLSLKAFDVPMMIAAYELAHERCDYPLHLGVTEAGPGVGGHDSEFGRNRIASGARNRGHVACFTDRRPGGRSEGGR